MKTEPKIRVYYNSACPICNAGINSQKKKSAVCGVEWEDVHLDNEKVKDLNANLEFVRERLHVVDTSGKLRVGLEAFIAIWENSPKEQWKANFSKLPVVRWLLNIIYNGFAWCLYKWNRMLNHW